MTNYDYMTLKELLGEDEVANILNDMGELSWEY
jgi:hypothetical protein